VGGDWHGPDTAQTVWTSPRAVRAATVKTVNGEAEDLLFYGGIAHIDASIKFTRASNGNELELRSQLPPELVTGHPLNVISLWLVEVNASDQLAYKAVPPIALKVGRTILTTISSHFSQSDFSTGNVWRLKALMHRHAPITPACTQVIVLAHLRSIAKMLLAL